MNRGRAQQFVNSNLFRCVENEMHLLKYIFSISFSAPKRDACGRSSSDYWKCCFPLDPHEIPTLSTALCDRTDMHLLRTHFRLNAKSYKLQANRNVFLPRVPRDKRQRLCVYSILKLGFYKHITVADTHAHTPKCVLINELLHVVRENECMLPPSPPSPPPNIRNPIVEYR